MNNFKKTFIRINKYDERRRKLREKNALQMANKTLQHKQWLQANLPVIHSQKKVVDDYKMLLFNFGKITF